MKYRISQVGANSKELPASVENIRDTGLIPGLGRSPGEGMATHPLQCSFVYIYIYIFFNLYLSLKYSCLKIPWIEEPGGLQSIGKQNRARLKQLSAHRHTHTREV